MSAEETRKRPVTPHDVPLGEWIAELISARLEGRLVKIEEGQSIITSDVAAIKRTMDGDSDTDPLPVRIRNLERLAVKFQAAVDAQEEQKLELEKAKSEGRLEAFKTVWATVSAIALAFVTWFLTQYGLPWQQKHKDAPANAPSTSVQPARERR